MRLHWTRERLQSHGGAALRRPRLCPSKTSLPGIDELEWNVKRPIQVTKAALALSKHQTQRFCETTSCPDIYQRGCTDTTAQPLPGRTRASPHPRSLLLPATPLRLPGASCQRLQSRPLILTPVSCFYSHTFLNCFHDKTVPLPTLIFSRIYLCFVLPFVNCRQCMSRTEVFMVHSTPTCCYLRLELLLKWTVLRKSNQITPRHIT